MKIIVTSIISKKMPFNDLPKKINDPINTADVTTLNAKKVWEKPAISI